MDLGRLVMFSESTFSSKREGMRRRKEGEREEMRVPRMSRWWSEGRGGGRDTRGLPDRFSLVRRRKRPLTSWGEGGVEMALELRSRTSSRGRDAHVTLGHSLSRLLERERSDVGEKRELEWEGGEREREVRE